MRFLGSALVVVTLTSVSAFGTVCKMGKQERKVEVVTTDAAKKVPCEVKYTRDGQEKTIYNAQNDAAFCDKKAEEFVAKLTSQGFQCEGAAPAEGAAAPAEKAAEAPATEMKEHEKKNPEKKAEPVQEKK